MSGGVRNEYFYCDGGVLSAVAGGLLERVKNGYSQSVKKDDCLGCA